MLVLCYKKTESKLRGWQAWQEEKVIWIDVGRSNTMTDTKAKN
jgi:hypothetical protein